METPPEVESVAGDQEGVTKNEYDDKSEIAVDFGPLDGKPTLDVVGDTAIVVVGGEQFEFDVPATPNEVTVNDSILTIKETA